MAFADALRDLAVDVDPYVAWTGLEYRDVTMQSYSEVVDELGYENAKKIPEVRRFLQALGVGVRNVIGQDAWVQALAKKISYFPNNATVIIPDVRFPNEAKFIKGSGQLWAVSRFNNDWTEFDNGIGRDHVSESHIPYLKTIADVQINAFDLASLKNEVLSGGKLDYLAEQRILW